MIMILFSNKDKDNQKGGHNKGVYPNFEREWKSLPDSNNY